MIKKILYLTTCLGLTPLVHAHFDAELKWEDGPHIGVIGSGDTAGESFAWGWQAQYNHNEYWSWEIALTTHDDEISRSLNETPGFTGDVDLDVNIYKAYLTGRVNLWGYNDFTCYLGLGLGYSVFDEDRSQLTNASIGNIARTSVTLRDEFSYHGALGFEFILDQRWEIFAELQYSVLETEIDVTIAQNTGTFIQDSKVNQDIDYDYVLYRLGLNYRF